MIKLFVALIVILAASSSFAEEYLECEPSFAVEWHLGNEMSVRKKGFTELDVTKMSDAQLTLFNGLLVFLNNDNPRPYVMVPDFIERDYTGKAKAISYRQRERQSASGITMIFDDPHCELFNKSGLSVINLEIDSYLNQSYACECLSEPRQAKLFD